MERRLFAKNLAALLAIPFVAKADQYVPNTGKKVTRKDSITTKDYKEEVTKVDFVGKNTMILQMGDKSTKILLSEISLESNKMMIEEFRFEERLDVVIKGNAISSSVRFCGRVIENNITNYFNGVKNGVKFTIFLEQNHYIEGDGFISEVSIDQSIGSDNISEFCIEIDGGIRTTYEDDLII